MKPAPDHGEPWQSMGDDEIWSDNEDEGTLAVANGCIRERIVTCVNACAGMADPEKEIAELRQALSGRTVSCEQCNTLATENQAMREAIHLAEVALDMADDEVYPPDANCSCHISPPCNDCVNNSQARETKDFIKRALAKLKPFITTKP